MPGRLIVAALFFLAAEAAGAEPVISAFAPGQLRHAEALLQQAQAAAEEGEYALARQLAAQAGLDARLAYGMSDSPFLRRDATRVHEESAHLREALPAASRRVPGQ
jgi:hypothetical protein